MTQKQYDELVKLMDSIESVDKSIIDIYAFRDKILNILFRDVVCKDETIKINGPLSEQIIVKEPPFEPHFPPFGIMYDDYKINIPEEYKYDSYKINIPEEYKFTGVDKMKFVTKDEPVTPHTYSQSPVISKDVRDALVEMSIGIYDEPSQVRYTNIHNP